MTEIVVKVDAEIYDSLEMLAKSKGVSIEELVIGALENLIYKYQPKIDAIKADEEFNRFTGDI